MLFRSLGLEALTLARGAWLVGHVALELGFEEVARHDHPPFRLLTQGWNSQLLWLRLFHVFPDAMHKAFKPAAGRFFFSPVAAICSQPYSSRSKKSY